MGHATDAALDTREWLAIDSTSANHAGLLPVYVDRSVPMNRIVRSLWIEDLARDLRFAARMLRHRPVLSVSAILTLMLGIGGTTAVLSLLDALLVKPLPVAAPDRLAVLAERRQDRTVNEVFTLATYDALQQGSRVLSEVIASSRLTAQPDSIELEGDTRKAFVQLVSDNYFAALGVPAQRGRVFQARQPGDPGEPIAVISEDYWRREYGSDAAAVGGRFRRGTREFTIAGIAPAGFRGTELDVPVDIWLPIDQLIAPNAPDRAQGRWMRVMGRLRDGVSTAQAEAEASGLLGRAVEWQPGGRGYSALRSRLYEPLLLVALVAMAVLLVACANLAILMMASTRSRDREIAIRAAIGASRRRLVRQLLTESVVLSTIGGVLGLAVAYWANAALVAFLPADQSIAAPNLRMRIDARAVVLAAGISALACVLFGVLPGLRATGGTAARALKIGAGERQSTRSGRILLVGQVVLCTVLLIVAAVFIRTLANLRGQDAGYRVERLVVADVEFPRSYGEARRDQLIEELRARISALPAVQVAAFSHVGQLSGGGIEFQIGFPGRELADADRTVIEQRISPGFLEAMGTPIVAGREFGPTDDARGPLVAIVNESFVRRSLQDTNALGARFFREGGSRSGEPMQIVGVVADSKWVNLRDQPPPMYYRPYRQMGGTPIVRLAIRVSADPDAVARELPGAARAVDRQLMLRNVVPFADVVDRVLVVERLVAHVSAWFGALALTIAAVGLYGRLAGDIVRRRREIGLRIAVGAHPAAVERMFVVESLSWVAAGVAIGIPVALMCTRLASSLLFELSPHDPVSIGAAVGALGLATLAAAYLPARNAARIDPVVALRVD